MSKFCHGCVVVGVEARAWHFPSLGPMVPDSLLSDTGLTYAVGPPYPVHRLRWVLGPLPSTGENPSGYPLCCWSSLGTQLSDHPSLKAQVQGALEHPSITQGPVPSPLPTSHRHPSFSLACPLDAPRRDPSLPFAPLPILSKTRSLHPLGIQGISSPGHTATH